MYTIDPRATIAARNNADLYQLVFSAHNLNYLVESYAFIGLDPSPPYYSDLTTLSHTDTEEQLAAIHQLRLQSVNGVGVKDGFSLLALEREGFKILFDANWVWAESSSLVKEISTQWIRVETVDELREWEKAWKACGSPTERLMFPGSLLASNEIAFFAQKTPHGIEAGCIANVSSDCVGLSNVFTRHDLNAAMADCAQLAADFGGGDPVVGYDSGPELESMIDIGFESVGPLRIWAVDKN